MGEYVADGLNGLDLSSMPHPLDPLSIAECEIARKAIVAAHQKETVLHFRSVYLEEPLKNELIPFLEAEHTTGITPKTPRPARLAHVQYDVVRDDKSHEYTESVVDLKAEKEVNRRTVDKQFLAAFTTSVNNSACPLIMWTCLGTGN